MVKRKKAEGNDSDGDQVIPIPIQTFLWRQTSPFIRPKLGKLCEASCMSFERVIVQNILHGLSPSLCEAIQSVSRWRVVQASLPHVIHCCASMLASRHQTNPGAKFTSNEIKLLYTLHWILLDAASECEDAEADQAVGRTALSYLHALDAIQLFVFLLVPLVCTLKESDFQSLKLENGLRLWEPLLHYRQPDIPCFSTPVKAKRVLLKAQRHLLKVNFNMANIYIGKGSSTNDIYLGFDCPEPPASEKPPEKEAGGSSPSSTGSPVAPIAHMSDICALSTTDTNTSVDTTCDVCHGTTSTTGRNDARVCNCAQQRRVSTVSATSEMSMLGSGVDKNFAAQRLESAISTFARSYANPDILSASYFDVAVLQCFFCPQWNEEGVYWGLRYIHQRLLEISSEVQNVEFQRERSRSLPTPEVRVFPMDFAFPTPSTPTRKDSVSVEANVLANVTLPMRKDAATAEGRREPSFKRMRVFIGDKMKQLRHRDSVDQFDLESRGLMRDFASESSSSLDNLSADAGVGGGTRPDSALSRLTENDEDSQEDEDKESCDSSSDNNRRRMAVSDSHRHQSLVITEEDDDSSGSGGSKQVRGGGPAVPRVLRSSNTPRPEPCQKPIITITSDSPEPSNSPNSPRWPTKHRESFTSVKLKPCVAEEVSTFQRSLTDSTINYYNGDEVEEVPGSTFYIQNNGQLNYHVILQGVHNISSRHPSSRVCAVIFNVVNCFLDLNIIERVEASSGHGGKGRNGKSEKQTKSRKKSEKDLESIGKVKENSTFSMAMETVLRVYKTLGCPHGCGEGVRGLEGDHLRTQGINCLTRLMRANPPQFRKFLQSKFLEQPLQPLLDNLHALLGFCAELATSPQGPGPRKSVAEPGHRTGYGNNFGEQPAGGGTVHGQLIVHLLKPLLTKFVESRKEILAHENIGLFCDIRQLLNYVKDAHGGTFRRIALSGLMDALKPTESREQESLKKVIRRTHSVTSESGDEREGRASSSEGSGLKTRQNLFRKKVKKHIHPGAISDPEGLDDTSSFHGRLSPRVSIAMANDEDLPILSKRKSSKFNIAWRRSTKSDHEDDSSSEMPNGCRDNYGSDHVTPLPSGVGLPGSHQKRRPMSFKAASKATLSFLTARRRIEDGLRSFSKRRQSTRESICDENLDRSGHDFHSLPSHRESIIIRERKLINSYAVKSGLLRFNFMLDCCNPGSLPDAHLIAALLDLEAPVVARAGLLLECSYFVSRCNRGDWPNWMKLNLPGFCQSGMLHGRSQPSGYRKNLMLQKSAGRLFHQWAEALGNHLADILVDESPDIYSVIDQVKEETKKKELRMVDDEEDFLDEATVNQSGSDCPFALKMVACNLLLEITTFLRETFQYLPKSKPFRREMSVWDKPETSRRWSSILGSPVNSDRSNSKSSQGEAGSHSAGIASDRKISFAVLGMSERSDSIHSSTTSISQLDAAADSKGRRVGSGAAGQKLLKARRGSGHTIGFKQNCSFKIKRPESGGSIKRVGSTKTRKVSTQSLHSAASVDDAPSSYAIFEEGSEAASVTVNEDPHESIDPNEVVDEHDYCRYMPWIKVVVQLANRSNFICDHQNFCHPNCYERQRRSCTRLITSLRKIYESEKPEVMANAEDTRKETEVKEPMKDKLKRRESVFQSSSPTSRRESTPLLDKVKVDASLINKAKAAIALEKGEEKKRKAKKAGDQLPVLKYLNNQVLGLTHCPLALITKAAPILSDDTYIDMMPVAWELLIESDQELAAAAAVMFILASVRVPEQTKELMNRVLHHQNVSHRISAIMRFGVLWRFRYQVWPRMEDGSNVCFKMPPPSIDFVLPSPTIGLSNLPIIDPPWMPHFKTKVEEVTINQKESKSFVTATTTRRKQQQQMIHRALLAEEDRRRAARENFHMTSVAITQQAAYEPALLHSPEDHEDALQEEIALAVASRRMSVAPVNRASNVRNLSGRHGSMFFGRSALLEGDDEKSEHLHSHHVQLAQQFFPSSICNSVLPIVYLLEDLEVNGDGIAVCEVAEKVIWNCLVEDPTLFMRTFLEKLTIHQRQEELIFLLRKMLYHLKALPAQTAHCLFNYLIGFIMFYVRSPAEGGQEAIAQALSLIWQVVPSVSGIYFKDLKQTLRKEQCDPTVMISANVPSTKKLIVHGPDLSSIPSQFPIQEDTQFLHILHESLDFFNIPPEEQSSYFLVDTKTNQMHNVNSYVRDFYFFRRNFYPQLSLVWMNPDEATAALEHQAFILKFLEIGKVLFSLSVIDSSQGQQVQSHVSFLHEELLKLPSFPRKALESDFDLYHGQMGVEIAGFDLMHKYAWTKLIGRMFQGMSSTVTHVGDLPLFLNVINGTLLLHADDTATLQLSLATFINACKHFKQVFATTGFMFIMPTLLKVYSNHQSNAIVCNAIEVACRQFFLLHRNPFVLQMFGSISPCLDLSGDPKDRDLCKVHSDEFFHLLLSLERNLPDNLDILEMVEGEKPLLPLDFCYSDSTDAFSVIDGINLCITVIAYACESIRARQMLVILEAILPNYLQHLKDETTKQDNPTVAREEMTAIVNLSVSIKSLVASCENMARNFSGAQQWQFESATNATNAVTNQRPTQNHANQSPKGNQNYYDEHLDIKFLQMEEGLGNWRRASQENESDVALQEFRQSRNSILSLIAEFFSHCSARTKALRRLFPDLTSRCPELLDHKTHNRLADIAHTLLKVAPYDPGTMKCTGLKRYMLEILPITDWSQTAIRPALNLIIRRLERLFNKIYKKPVLRRHLDWNAATNLIKGINSTLVHCAYVAHFPHMKMLIATCSNIILADDANASSNSGSVHSVVHKTSDGLLIAPFAPPKFCSAVIKLMAQQMQALGEQYTLEQICGGSSVFPTVEKTANILINLILPLCIRMGSGRVRRDYPRMRQADMSFALTVMLNALLPPEKQQVSTGSSRLHHLSASEGGRGSIMSHHSRKSTAPRDGIQNVAFLGLKILIVCFEKQLSTEWHRISKCIMDLGTSQMGGSPLWRFLDFVMTVRSPLFVLLLPFVEYKMMKAACETEQEYYLQQLVHQKMRGYSMPDPKSKGSVLIDLAAELKQAKDELSLTTGVEGKTNLSSPVHSDFSHRSNNAIPRTSSIHDLLEYQVMTRQQLAPPTTTTAASKKLCTAGSLDNDACDHVDNISAEETRTTNTVTASPPVSVSLPLRVINQATIISESPALARKASKRITALEGSLILEKYSLKSVSQEEDINVTRWPLVAMTPRRLTANHHFPHHPSSATSATPPSYGSIFKTDGNHTRPEQVPAEDDEFSGQRLHRNSPVILRGVLRKLGQSSSLTVAKNNMARKSKKPGARGHVRFLEENIQETLEQITDGPEPGKTRLGNAKVDDGKMGSSSSFHPRNVSDDPDAVHMSTLQNYDPHMHRLQRQDAKSRKTFKIKRNRSTIKNSMTRSATVKGGTKYHATLVEGSQEQSVAEPDPVEAESEDSPGLARCVVPNASIKRKVGIAAAMDLEMQPVVAMEIQAQNEQAAEGENIKEPKPRSSRPARFMQKSRSHDDASDSYAPAGTARARIARHGARLLHSSSRSPSSSPTHPSPAGGATTQREGGGGGGGGEGYLTRSESTESLNTGEDSSLLTKEEKKNLSNTTILVYFGGNELQDTRV